MPNIIFNSIPLYFKLISVVYAGFLIDFSQDTVDLISTGRKSLVLTKGLAFNFDKTCSLEKMTQ